MFGFGHVGLEVSQRHASGGVDRATPGLQQGGRDHVWELPQY